MSILDEIWEAIQKQNRTQKHQYAEDKVRSLEADISLRDHRIAELEDALSEIIITFSPVACGADEVTILQNVIAVLQRRK